MRTARPFLQMALILFAIYVAMTRISDYKHHPMDIVAGMAVGITWGTFLHLSMMKLFENPLTFWSWAHDNNDHTVDYV